MKSKKNTFVSRAAVGCVTTAIFLLLCIIKGIYPFGIATLDTVDFQSQWIPAYYHVWDCDYCNLQSDINSAEVNQIISPEQAWYLREKYLRMERE